MVSAGKPPSINEYTHTHIFTYVYIPSITLGEAAVMGAQEQMHM